MAYAACSFSLSGNRERMGRVEMNGDIARTKQNKSMNGRVFYNEGERAYVTMGRQEIAFG